MNHSSRPRFLFGIVAVGVITVLSPTVARAQFDACTNKAAILVCRTACEIGNAACDLAGNACEVGCEVIELGCDICCPLGLCVGGCTTCRQTVTNCRNACQFQCDLCYGGCPLCNHAPTCSADGPYVEECTGSTTEVGLSSTSSDPDGDPLTLNWSTDCTGGSFDNPHAPSPHLTLDSPGSCPELCHAFLNVTDGKGGSANCVGDITVDDNTDPSVNGVPAKIKVECDAVPAPSSAPTAKDTCDPNPKLNVNRKRADGVCNDTYTLTDTWTATDACGHTDEDSQTINVNDTTPPIIATCQEDIFFDCVDNPGRNVAFALPTGTDNCDGSPVAACDPAPGSFFNTGLTPTAGTTKVTCTLTDDCGNFDTCEFNVTLLACGACCDGTTSVCNSRMHVNECPEAPVSASGAACSTCGKGAHFVEGCSAGSDQIGDVVATLGIDTDLDCVVDTNFILGPCLAPDAEATIQHGDPDGGGHPEIIDTEIVEMCLTGAGTTLRIGAGQGGVTEQTFGGIDEQPSASTLADSFFDVFFEVEFVGGALAYNHSQLHLEAEVDCVPPRAAYQSPNPLCLPLFDAPVGGVHVANLVTAELRINDTDNQLSWSKDEDCSTAGPICIEHTGACCLAGVCEDDVAESDCTFLAPKKPGQFFKGMTCNDPIIAATCAAKVPAVSVWGVVTLVLFLLGGLAIKFRRVGVARG